MPSFSPNPRTAPTVNTVALRGPENQLAARVVVDMQDDILLYMPKATPLLTLTGKLREKRQATNYRFDWMEKDTQPRFIDVSADATDVATAITIPNGQEARAAAGYVMRNQRTGEQILVTTTAAGSLSVVVRGIGGGAAPMLNGDRLYFLRSVYEDGAGAGAPRSIQEFAYFNYTEIIRTPFGFTGRDLVTELYGGKDEMTETKWQGVEHKKSIEQAMWFGKRHLRTGTGGHQQSFMGGIDSWITTNVWNASTVDINFRAINEFLESAMKWGKGGNLSRGSGTKYLFASSRWVTIFNDLAIQKLQTRVLDEQIGFECFEYVSPHGKVMILPTPLFDDVAPDTAYLLDMNHVRYAYLRGRDTKLLYDRQANDVDGKINEYFSDVSAQVEFEHAHSKLILGA
jgi:hypothetical protein